MLGKLELYLEQGHEGSPYAFQDSEFIHDQPCEEKYCPVKNNCPEHWLYDGLHIIEPGDYIKILTPLNKDLVFESYVTEDTLRLFEKRAMLFDGFMRNFPAIFYPQEWLNPTLF